MSRKYKLHKNVVFCWGITDIQHYVHVKDLTFLSHRNTKSDVPAGHIFITKSSLPYGLYIVSL